MIRYPLPHHQSKKKIRIFVIFWKVPVEWKMGDFSMYTFVLLLLFVFIFEPWKTVSLGFDKWKRDDYYPLYARLFFSLIMRKITEWAYQIGRVSIPKHLAFICVQSVGQKRCVAFTKSSNSSGYNRFLLHGKELHSILFLDFSYYLERWLAEFERFIFFSFISTIFFFRFSIVQHILDLVGFYVWPRKKWDNKKSAGEANSFSMKFDIDNNWLSSGLQSYTHFK